MYFAMYILKPDVNNANCIGRRQHQHLVRVDNLAALSDRSFRDRVSDYQEGSGVDERRSIVCGRHVPAGGIVYVWTG